MDPKTKFYPVNQFNAQLYYLEKAGMKPPRILRMIHLLFGGGLNTLIDAPGIYHHSRFWSLCVELHYETISELLCDVRRSQWFFVAEDSSAPCGVRWFASPVFFNECDVEKAHIFGGEGDQFSAASLRPQTPAATDTIETTPSINTLRSIKVIPPGRTATPSTGSAQGDSASRKKSLSRAEKGVELDRFISDILDPSNRDFFLTMTEILQSSGCSPLEIDDAINYLMKHTVRKHFLDQERFFTTSFDGRKSWLTNFIYGKCGPRRISAALMWSRKRRQEAEFRQQQQDCRTIRDNHVISPYEWQYEGRRFYDDPVDGTTLIPDSAPPRPSDTAVWINNDNQWIQST